MQLIDLYRILKKHYPSLLDYESAALTRHELEALETLTVYRESSLVYRFG